MTSEHDLTTEQGLSAYLTSHSISHVSVSILTGGTANYVYRVTFPDGSTAIYKHAAPYLHSNTAFAFDPRRMDYEDRILELLPSLLSSRLSESPVHAVAVHRYDKGNKLLRISDGGSRNLKDTYANPTLDIPSVGAALGRWLATLHTSTVATPLSLDPASQNIKDNNAVAVSIYRHSYNNLSSAFAAYSDGGGTVPGYADFIDLPNKDIEFAQQINDAYGSRLAHDNECICHGDFWPGNVLVRPAAEEGGKVNLTVVDWEMTRRGTSATDPAQFLAESFLLDRFCGDRGLAPAFLNAYLSARSSLPDKEWFRRLAIHFAVHVAFWPTRVVWTDRAGTQALVELGKGILRAASESNWDVLFGLPVFGAMEKRYRPTF
ncbi:hypothetical protein P171DRAFT_430394 [Karstenula rhodostoma CBS 690.94]|uniref:Aminoglycoside phosphotransferase domain-containing protein n=1 Tax=Karstenula rhodostoma CBS 690.94 TaxID=1392251 RepID=A0A9P4PLF9_9PLEO|nr:hypothetical protein P171DRAFT_430394 [Karstenula rhodostoma CBS 690.94]